MSSLEARRKKMGGEVTAPQPLTATGALQRMNERPRDVRLDDITLDWRLQFRMDVKKTGLDEKHLIDLMHVIADGQDTEPVILYRVDDALLMADGFHRVEAYRRSERTTIPAIVRDGTYEDAEEFAEEANLQYRKRLSDESKKYIFARRVERGYQTNGVSWNNLSDKAIAAQLGVSYQAVSNWFEELETGVKFLTPDGQEIFIQVAIDRSVVYGRDGKRYEAEVIRKKNQERAEIQRLEREEAERQRREQEKEEQLAAQKSWSVIRKFEYLAEWLISVHNPRLMKAGEGLWIPEDDSQKDYSYFMQLVAAWQKNPSIRLNFDESKQWVSEFGGHPWIWFMGMVGDLEQPIYEQAKLEGWSEEALEDWAREHGGKRSTAKLELPGEKRAASEKDDYKPAQPTGGVFPRSESARQAVKSGRFAIGQMVHIKSKNRNATIIRAFWGGTEWKYVLDHDANVAFWESELLAMNEARELDPNRAKFRVGDIVRLLATGEIDEVIAVISTDGNYEYKLSENAEGLYAEDTLAAYRLDDVSVPKEQELKDASFASIVGEDESDIPTPSQKKAATRPNEGYSDHRKAMYALWEISSACDQISQGFGKLLGITRENVLASLTLADMKDIKKRLEMLAVAGSLASGEGMQRTMDLHGILSHFVETQEIVEWFTDANADQLEGWTEATGVQS